MVRLEHGYRIELYAVVSNDEHYITASGPPQMHQWSVAAQTKLHAEGIFLGGAGWDRAHFDHELDRLVAMLREHLWQQIQERS